MKKFIIKNVLFLLPFFFILLFINMILIITGEISNLDEIIQKQNKNKMLFGLAFSEPKEYYKFNSTLCRNPNILVLGSSRTLQFRSNFFNDNVNFYNAGGMIDGIYNLIEFIENYPIGSELKILILGLDQFWFNEKYDDLVGKNYIAKYFNYSNINVIFKKKPYSDFLKGKIKLNKIFNKNVDVSKIGINALINNQGYRNDGSYYYGKIIENPNNPSLTDYKFKNTLWRIENNTLRFEYGDSLNPKAISVLEKFLKECKKRNIHIIAFLPPFANKVYKAILSKKGKYGYFFSLETNLKPIFKKYNHSLYNFSSFESVGSSDKEALDGFHGSEKTYLRLYLEILKNETYLSNFSDYNFLKNKLTNTKSDLEVFYY